MTSPLRASIFSGESIARPLTRVAFHLANQTRLFDQALKGWLKSQLCDVELAMQSLRLMAPDRSNVPAS